MLNIKIIATGSGGNCYLIEENKKSILIDPGIPISDIRGAVSYPLSEIDFCLLTHEHNDHAKDIHKISRAGVKCYMSQGTLEAVEKNKPLKLRDMLQPEIPILIDGWYVLPFNTVHDSRQPFGYLINTPLKNKILFATDTSYINYDFIGVTHFIVECNFESKLLAENEEYSNDLKYRIDQNHMELSRLVAFFARQDLTLTEKIYLIHLSDLNSDKDRFIKEIQEVTGKPVYTG